MIQIANKTLEIKIIQESSLISIQILTRQSTRSDFLTRMLHGTH